jgi:glycosyltransferase involved in cell wall biosynthesis
MNIGIVTPQLSQYGGSEIYLLECLKRWQDDVDLTVYTPSFRRQLFTEFGISRRVRVGKLPAGRSGRYAFFHNTVILPRLWEQLVGPHDLYFLYLFPTQFISRRPSVWFGAEPLRALYDLRHHHNGGDAEVEVHFYPKLQYDRARVSELDIFLHLIEKIDSAPTFDRLATNSRATGQYLANVYGRSPDRVVYPGVNAPVSTSPPSPSKPLLCVGNLWRHKRVDLIIRALARLPRRKLTVVGVGPEKSRLRRLATSLGLGERVVFRGRVSQAELERLYAGCSLCVYTPVREPFGMVPLEAAAAGRPVVATAGGGYNEILDNSCARFVPADPEAIAFGIRTILEDPDLARRMGAAGRRIATSYTWDRTAGSLLDLFRETVESRPPHRKSYEKTRLGAHYYPWYRAGKRPEHWNENREFAALTDYPVSGPYSSNTDRVVRRHLAMAQTAGLDFLVVNWQVTSAGLNPTEVTATRRLFAAAEKRGAPLRLAILLAITTEDARVVAEALNTVRSQFMPSPAYHQVRGRPAIWYYLTDSFLGFFFHRYDDVVRLNRGCWSMATGQLIYNKFLPDLLRRFFSGWCIYSPLQVGRKALRDAIWTRAYRDFSEEGGPIRVFTICPGYDDSALTSAERRSGRYRVTPRDETRTYQRMQRVALKLTPPPDLVVVTSFNEFHENTHIEPSRSFGDLYLKSTRAFKDAFHS